MSTTCQVCGRAIRAASGRIAHHGYQRPGGGWQTASCRGARHVPYEVGHDALDAWIEELTALYIPETRKRIAGHLDSPPAQLDVRWMRGPHGGFRQREPILRDRPVDFVPLRSDERRPYSHHESYEGKYYDILDGLRRRLRDQRAALSYATARRQAWVAPEAGQ